jgi:hypothetical protein
VSCEGHQREKVRAGTAREAALGYKRERSGGVPLCRYIARPAVAVPRLSLSSTGKVVYSLKARGSRRPTGMVLLKWVSRGRPSAL